MELTRRDTLKYGAAAAALFALPDWAVPALAAGEVDVLDMAGRLRCRTLIIHAERDAVAPLHEGRLLAARIPGASYVLLDSDNHILMTGTWSLDGEGVLPEEWLKAA